MGRNSVSGVPGVTRDQRSGKWRVYVKVGGKQRSLGIVGSVREGQRLLQAHYSASPRRDSQPDEVGERRAD